MKIKTRLSLWKWYCRDYLIFGNRGVIAYFFIGVYAVFSFLGIKHIAFRALLFSDRLFATPFTRNCISKKRCRIVEYSFEYIDKQEVENPRYWIDSRCTVLVKPSWVNGKIKRGVLIINFSTTFIDVLKELDCERLLEEYWVVLEPSWAGYALPEILAWTRFNCPILVEASEIKDRELILCLDSNLIPVSYGASDWVEHSVFSSPRQGEEKIYDSIFVANYNSIKRHYVYFSALREIIKELPDYKAAMVCGDWGGSRPEVLNLISDYGLDGVVSVFEEIPQKELSVLINQSKVNVLLTLKEGSNRSLFEGMFAGAPAIVLKENVGVNKDYFTETSGMAISESNFIDALKHFYHNYNDYDARSWALDNISPEKTTEKLSEDIKSISGADYDLPIKINRPESVLREKNLRVDAGAEIYDRFLK